MLELGLHPCSIPGKNLFETQSRYRSRQPCGGDALPHLLPVIGFLLPHSLVGRRNKAIRDFSSGRLDDALVGFRKMQNMQPKNMEVWIASAQVRISTLSVLPNFARHALEQGRISIIKWLGPESRHSSRTALRRHI
jgi:hypothetical protein